MKRKCLNKYVYLQCVILFFLFSCNDNEKEVNLGNNFFYIPSQEIIFDVTTFDGNGIYLCGNSKKTPVILPDVEEFKYNSDFIIIKQNFNYEQTKRLIENMLFMPKVYFTFDKNYIKLNEDYLAKLDTSEQNSIYSQKFTNELLRNSTEIQKMKNNKENYYIIKKKELKIYGPLSKSEFEINRQSFKINLSFD